MQFRQIGLFNLNVDEATILRYVNFLKLKFEATFIMFTVHNPISYQTLY